MSFWDNFAGGMAGGLASGAQIGMKLVDQSSELKVREDANNRASERMSWDRTDRSDKETVAGIALGAGSGMAEPSLEEKVDGTPAPRAAIPAPNKLGGVTADGTPAVVDPAGNEVEETQRAAAAAPAYTPAPPAKVADKVGAIPAPRSASADYDGQIARLEAAAREGKVRKSYALQTIENLRAKKAADVKAAGDREYQQQQISESKTRQSVSEQGLTEARFKQNLAEGMQFYQAAHAKVSQLSDDNMPVTDPSIKGFVDGALKDYELMYDKIDDGKDAEVVRGKDGIMLRLTDTKSGELVEEYPIKTVRDLRAIDTVSRQIAMGEGAVKYAAAATADRVASQLRSTVERGAKASVEMDARKSESMPKVLDTMDYILNATTEEKLSPEYKARVMQAAQEGELLFPDIVAPKVKVPATDPDTGEPMLDANGKQVMREVRQNKILLMAAQVEPNTKIKLPSGKAVEAETLIQRVLQNAPEAIKASNGDVTQVGMNIYQQLVQGGVDDEAAQILAQQAVAQLGPAVKGALAPAAMPMGLKSAVPQRTGSAGGINPNNPPQPMRPATPNNPRSPGYALPAR